jgi:lysozyme
MSRPINSDGLALIKRFEGLRLKAYKCPAGVWTIGYGHTGDVKPEHELKDEHQADIVLKSDLERYEECVERLAPGLNDNQFSALVSFAFNLGETALARSTLLKHVLAQRFEQAGAQFLKWHYAAGKVLPGLVKRRAAERELFLKT